MDLAIQLFCHFWKTLHRRKGCDFFSLKKIFHGAEFPKSDKIYDILKNETYNFHKFKKKD